MNAPHGLTRSSSRASSPRGAAKGARLPRRARPRCQARRAPLATESTAATCLVAPSSSSWSSGSRGDVCRPSALRRNRHPRGGARQPLRIANVGGWSGANCVDARDRAPARRAHAPRLGSSRARTPAKPSTFSTFSTFSNVACDAGNAYASEQTNRGLAAIPLRLDKIRIKIKTFHRARGRTESTGPLGHPGGPRRAGDGTRGDAATWFRGEPDQCVASRASTDANPLQ